MVEDQAIIAILYSIALDPIIVRVDPEPVRPRVRPLVATSLYRRIFHAERAVIIDVNVVRRPVCNDRGIIQVQAAAVQHLDLEAAVLRTIHDQGDVVHPDGRALVDLQVVVDLPSSRSCNIACSVICHGH